MKIENTFLPLCHVLRHNQGTFNMYQEVFYIQKKFVRIIVGAKMEACCREFPLPANSCSHY